MTTPPTTATTSEESGPILSVWEKEYKEFRMDCYRVTHGIVSSDSCTRYNSKQDAKAALNKMLDSWRYKKNKKLVKYLDIDSNAEANYLGRDIDNMVDCNCLKCGKPTVVQGQYSLYRAECNECNFNRRKLEHEQKYRERLEQRKQEDDKRDPIEKYVRQIRGDKSEYWEVPFDRAERFEVEHAAEMYAKSCVSDYNASLFPHDSKNKDNFVQSFLNLHADELSPSEKLIEELKKKWTWIKHKTKREREERKEYERDRNFAFDNSPMHKYEFEILPKIGCECYSENVRQTGNVCKTCRLMLKVREYTVNLLRDAARDDHSLTP